MKERNFKFFYKQRGEEKSAAENFWRGLITGKRCQARTIKKLKEKSCKK